MPLAIGARLGPYEIVSALGAGGMGEVYRARDTRLGRDVAVKVIPDRLAGDTEARLRFDREARAISSLNHPHICALYDVGSHDGMEFLVMELVEGETVAARLERGPMPVADVLKVGVAVADALDKAHRRGLVHRDLKPQNIMLTKAGAKLLDFGLARPIAPGGGTASALPTMTRGLTERGAILGTFQYMSPEQLEGREVDGRADIWALGATLYEMVTGARAFEGQSTASLIGAILRDEPRAIADRQPLAPAELQRVVSQCLAKDPDDRWQSAGDLKRELEWVMSRTSPGAADSGAATSLTRRARARGAFAWLPVAVAALAAGAVGGWWIASRGPARGPTAVSVVQLTDQVGVETAPSLSPDGLSFVYESTARGSADIYVQRVGGRNPILVAGDPVRAESAPAFSPDGTLIAFHEADSDGGIFIVGATGESARRLTDSGFHPAWAPDGREIAFCTEAVTLPYTRTTTSSLWIVPVAGGPPRKLFDGDAVQPAWSPSGTRLAFWAAPQGQRDLFTIAAAGGPPSPVTSDAALDWAPTWSPDGGTLYFSSDRGGTMSLWRIGIDQTTGASRGEPEPVTLATHASIEQQGFSKDGSKLVFRSTLQSINPAAIPFDPVSERFGEPRPLFRRTAMLVPTSISRDGQWLALGNPGERQEDIFVCRIDGSDLTRLTDDVARDRVATWSPDGRQLAFYSNRSGRYQIWTIARDGGSLRQVSNLPEDELHFPMYSADGAHIYASAYRPNGPVFMLDPSRPSTDRPPTALPLTLAPGETFRASKASSDGRRLVGRLINAAGVTSGVGVYELGTRAFRVIPTEGLSVAMEWLPDNRRVIAMMASGDLLLLDVETGRRRTLTLPRGVQVSNWAFTFAADGRTLYVGSLERDADIWMMTLK